MSEKLDTAWLIALGTDVSEGRPVDWERIQRLPTDAETRRLIESLRQLATVVEAQRSIEPVARAEANSGESRSTGHWRHLVLYEQVGAGAFGTVFRGWDTQLDREVALKLLSKPRGTTASPLSEAKHLARVRHPNVVTIYGAEQDDEQVGIWMEFIQGDTLAAMVQQRGPMSAREVAGIGIDLCRALSALHSVSLLHRDIKAHNVMRELGGRIVLMDFSGVRALVEPDSPSELSGTPLYMAPELFEGGGASVSSDIYSLGVLLFYLLSGRYPVEGRTVSDLKVAHTGSTRTRLRDLRPELPEAIVQIVERACAADARSRPHSLGEVEHSLMGALGTHVLPAASVAGEPIGAAAARAEKTRRRGWFVATAAVAMLILLLAAWPNPSPAPDPLVVRLTIGPPYNNLSWPRVSPDGRQIVYGTIVARNVDGKVVGQEFLWVWPLDRFEGRPLLEAAARETAFWSADSQHVGYFEGGKLKRVAVNGGQPQVLCDVLNPRGADWSADGVILFASDNGIHRISASGGAVETVTSLDESRGETQHSWPEFLPDGRRFLYVVRSQREEHAGIYLGSLDSPVTKRVMPAYSRTVYAPSGHLLFVQNGTLMAQRFDERSEQLVGDPIAFATPVKYHESGDAGFDVSNNGVLIYRLPEGPMRLQMYDRRGLQLQEVAGVGFYRHPRLSPDGQRVAVERFGPGDLSPDIWLYDMQGRTTRFTSDEAPDHQPAWSPDGRQIAFSSKRGPQFDVYVKTVNGTEPERLLSSLPGNKYVESWSADGQYLIVSIVRSGLWLVPLRKEAKPSLVRASKAVQEWQAEMSADGRWIAYVSSDSGRAEVYIEPVPGGTGVRWQISSAGGSDPHWRGDSRELIYMSPDGSLMSVDMSAAPRFQGGAARRLFRIAVSEPLGPSDWSLSRDGEFALVNALVGDVQAPPIHVVVNWQQLVGQ